MRTEFAVPLHLLITSDVPRYLAEAAELGVQDAMRYSGQQRRLHVFHGNCGTGEHGSPDWYIGEIVRKLDRALPEFGAGPQLSSCDLRALLEQDPHQVTPHWDILLMNYDLTGPRSNFVFGITDPNFPVSIQSVTRFIACGFTGLEKELGMKLQEEQKDELRALGVRRVLRHEVAHMFGLLQRDFEVEEKLLGKHCVNVCAMRQELDVESWIKDAVEETQAGICYCNTCRAELAEFGKGIMPLP